MFKLQNNIFRDNIFRDINMYRFCAFYIKKVLATILCFSFTCFLLTEYIIAIQSINIHVCLPSINMHILYVQNNVTKIQRNLIAFCKMFSLSFSQWLYFINFKYTYPPVHLICLNFMQIIPKFSHERF